MARRDESLERILGDVAPDDPFDIGSEAPSGWSFSLPDSLNEPVTWGWLLLIVAVLVLLIIVL